MYFLKFFVAALVAGSVMPTPASAKIAIYTLTGQASGAIGSNSFSNVDFTFKSITDTSGHINCQIGSFILPGCQTVINSSAHISLNGLGKYSLTSVTYTFYNETAKIAGFGNAAAPGDVVHIVRNGGFGSWTLGSVLAPVDVTTSVWNPGLIMTSGGALSFIPGQSSGTFQVSVGGVPEPTTWAMMIAGFGAIGIAMRRKRQPLAWA